MKPLLIFLFHFMYLPFGYAQMDSSKNKILAFMVSSKEVSKEIKKSFGKKAYSFELSKQEVYMDTIFRAIKTFRSSKDTIFECLNNKIDKFESKLRIVDNADFTLFLSHHQDNHLMVELLPNKKPVSILGEGPKSIRVEDYHALRSFNKGLRLFFIFDLNDKIICVTKDIIHYD